MDILDMAAGTAGARQLLSLCQPPTTSRFQTV
jgi:hypothetical protein